VADRVNGRSFEAHVARDVEAGPIDKKEFEQLQTEYASLSALEKYAVNSWLAGNYPELADVVGDKTNGWANYTAATTR